MNRLLWIAVVACWPAGSAPAALIIGNLPQTNDFNAVALYDTSGKAVAFTMGSQSYTLDAAVLRLDFLTGSPIVQLRNDVGGADPGGSVLATFTTPAAGSGIQNYTFTPTAPTTLAANTKYWLYVFGAGDDFGQAAYWYRSNPNIEPSGAGAVFNDYRTTSDGGGSWSGSPTTPYNSFELQGSISAVPEPSSLVLIGSVLFAGGVRRRLRRR